MLDLSFRKNNDSTIFLFFNWLNLNGNNLEFNDLISNKMLLLRFSSSPCSAPSWPFWSLPSTPSSWWPSASRPPSSSCTTSRERTRPGLTSAPYSKLILTESFNPIRLATLWLGWLFLNVHWESLAQRLRLPFLSICPGFKSRLCWEARF